MKSNWIMIVILLLLSSLIGYGFYTGNANDENVWLITIGSGISIFLTLSGAFGLKQKSGGFAVNISVVSILFFIIFVVSNVIFSFIPMVSAVYIIVNGIFLLLYLIVFYALFKAL